MNGEAQYTLEMKVRDYEVDSEGIVNNACYLNYFEHTRHEFCMEAGLSFDEMLRRGMAPVVRHVEVDYVRSLRSGQPFSSHLSLSRRGARFLFHQWITNAAGEMVTEAKVTIVNLLNGRPTRGDELAETFSRFLC